MSKTIGILCRLKSAHPLKELLTFYNTLMLPYFNYCILSLGSVIKNNHHLHLLQKKAVRIITNNHFNAHIEPLLKELGLLKITNIFSLAIWKFYFKLMSNQLPAYFTVMEQTLLQVCTRYEIRKPLYPLPNARHTFAEQSLRYCLIKHLNPEGGYADLVHSTSFLYYKLIIIIISLFTHCNRGKMK